MRQIKKEVEKAIEERFSVLPKSRVHERDVKYLNATYWEYLDRQTNLVGDRGGNGLAELLEPVRANPDSLSESLWDDEAKNERLQNLRDAVKKIRISVKDRAILNEFLLGYSQVEIAQRLRIKQPYISARIKSVCDKIKKYL